MNFFRRVPRTSEVRDDIVRFVQAAKLSANAQAQQPNRQEDSLPLELTLNVIAISIPDLVPQAKRILTIDVAKKVDSSNDEAKILTGRNDPSAIPFENLDSFLHLVMATVESWLGRSSGMLNFYTVVSGIEAHSQRGIAYARDKKWNNAEHEYRYALGYSFQHSNTMFQCDRVILLKNLGDCFWNQQKNDDAKECWQDALNNFSRLPGNVSGYEEAAAVASEIREIQTRLGV